MLPENPYYGWKRKIAFFLASQTVSMFGSSLVQFAIIWYIAKATDSGVMIAVSTLCAFLPQLVMSIFGGVLADRYSRKGLIVAADLSIAAATLVLALFMAFGVTRLWMIFLVSAVRSLGSGIQSPAVSALTPQIVPEDQLMRVSGLTGSIFSLVNLASPAVGGAVLTYGAFHNVLWIDIVTAVIGVSILLAVKVPPHKKAMSEEKADYFADLREGVRYSVEHGFIRRLLKLYVVFSVLLVPAAFMNVLMVTRVFGDTYWNLTLNEMAFFVGAVVGGGLLSIWGGFKNRLYTLCLACVGFGALTVVVGFTKVFWIYLVIMFFTGATMPMFNSPVTVLIQEKVDQDMQGRVFSIMQIVSLGSMLVGLALAGPLADVVAIDVLMIISGALMLVFGVLTTRYKSLIAEGVKKADALP